MPEFIVALVVTVAIVPLTMAAARRWGVVAKPRADRWGRGSVPRLGGLAVAAGLVAGATTATLEGPALVAMLIGTLVTAALGLADDLFEVAPIIRLVTQAALGVFVGTALTWQGGWGADVVPLTVLAVLAVPLLVNATNLVDNADGLASTLSALSGLSLAAIAAVVGASDGVSIGLVLAAAGIGFLLYNSPPARVFMGDVGSLPFGFGIAVASLLLVDEAVVAGAWSVVLAIPAAWAVQLGDLGMVFITRINRGTSPFRGGVDHTSHRLMKAGLSPRQTLAALAAAAGVAGLLGVWSASSGQPALAAAVAIGLGAAVISLETWLVRNVPHDSAPVAVAATARTSLSREAERERP